MPSDGPFGKVPEISVGVSDAVLLIVSGIGFCMLAVTVYSIVIARLKSAQEIDEEDDNLDYDEKLAKADPSTLNRAQRRARARHIMKQQRRVAPAATPGAAGENEEGALALLEDDDPQDQEPPLSRKERQKAAKMAEKEERKMFEDERQQQQRVAQEAARKEKRERERKETEHTLEQRRLRQERKHTKDQEDYVGWKTFLKSPDGTKRISVKDWITAMTGSRTVHVDDLADQYRVSSSEVVRRIEELLESARVTGVLEDDGRFFYVTQQEMASIADYVRKQDAVTLLQVSRTCNDKIGK